MPPLADLDGFRAGPGVDSGRIVPDASDIGIPVSGGSGVPGFKSWTCTGVAAIILACSGAPTLKQWTCSGRSGLTARGTPAMKQWTCTGRSALTARGTPAMDQWTCTGRSALTARGTPAMKQWTCTGTATISSPFVPTDLSNLSIWLDANVGLGLTGANVDSWADQSGTAYNFQQTTGAQRPQYNATAINGHPGIQFNGSTQWLESVGTSASTKVGTQFTTFIVTIQNVPGTATSYGASYAAPPFMCEGNPGGNWGMHCGSDKFISYHWASGGTPNGNDVSARPAISAATAIMVHGQYDGTNEIGKSAIETKTTATNVGATSVGAGTHLYIGKNYTSGSYFNGYIGEIIHYSRSLNSTEIAQVEAYLTAKWGL